MEQDFEKMPVRNVNTIVNSILEDYKRGRSIDRMEDFFDQPDKDVIIDIVDKMLKIIYPGYYRDKVYKSYNVDNHLSMLIEDVMYRLNKQIVKVSKFCPGLQNMCQEKIDSEAYRITVEFLSKIPKIRECLEDDLQAALEGDPAANSFGEIILAYPGLFAITVNRLAHELFLLSVPLIPRIMTEYAHSVTGIDIHPGATIGKHFFIDHGTGIVVGETTVIGDNVKIYQGVTLGALSTRGGQKLKNVKRHPTIEDNVTIYAGASILGGDTVIGKGSVIGSNAFITKSISAGTTVSIKNQELSYKQAGHGALEISELEQDENWFYII
jgi:serine O-acetyltransferase